MDEEKNNSMGIGGIVGTTAGNKFSAKPQNQTTPDETQTDGEDDPRYNRREDLLYNVDLSDYIRDVKNYFLNTLDNYTWRFTLYTYDQPEYFTYIQDPTNDTLQKYILAESGVTGRYNINSVDMINVCPATPALTTNHTLLTVNIELIEQNGMRLFDDLNILSKKLKYYKFSDIPFLLDLSFVGYDGAGKAVNLSKFTKTWAVRINEIPAVLDNDIHGTKYNIKMVSNRTYRNGNWIIKKPFTCGASTFLEFIESLNAFMNEEAEDDYGSYVRDVIDMFNDGVFHEFKVDPTLDMVIDVIPNTDEESDSNSPSGSGDAKGLSWEAGTAISKIIDDVIDFCQPERGEANTSADRIFVHVIPISYYAGYDFYKQVHLYKYDTYIIKYYIGDAVHALDTQERFYAYNLMEELKENNGIGVGSDDKFFMKTYNYKFTGVNEEILNLDMKFDAQFNISIGMNESEQIDPFNRNGISSAPDLSGSAQIQSLNIQMGENRTKYEQNAKKIEDENTSDAERAKLEAENEQLDVEYDQHKKDLNNANSEGSSSTESSKTDIYIEDFANYSYNDLVSINDKFYEMTLSRYNTRSFKKGGGNNSNSSDAIVKRKLAKSNYYNRSFLLSLNMDVIGDTYWLGHSDYDFIRALNKIVESDSIDVNSDTIANFINSESYFLLNLMPVVTYNDKTGVVDNVGEPSVLNQSIYRVLQVKSYFRSDGTFKQTLQGALITRSLNRKNLNNDDNEQNGVNPNDPDDDGTGISTGGGQSFPLQSRPTLSRVDENDSGAQIINAEDVKSDDDIQQYFRQNKAIAEEQGIDYQFTPK